MHAIDLGVIITLIRAILRVLFELVDLLLDIDRRAARHQRVWTSTGVQT